MFTIIAFCIVSGQSDDPFWASVFFDKLRFEVKDGWIRRLSDDTSILLSYRQARTASIRFEQRQLVVQTRPVPSDGYPLGKACEIYARPSHFDVRVGDGREIVEIVMSAPVDRKPEGLVPRPYDYSGDEAWVVAAVREVMAKFASRRHGATGSVAVRGHAVSSFVAQETDVRFVDFDQYLSALGVAPERNETDKRYAFTVAGTNFLVLLGTSKMKVGSEWRSMQDQPMLINGRAFVPIQYLPD